MSTAQPPTPRRVAVIGAGPAGAIVTDALVKEQAFETIRVFERRPAVGGTWFYTPQLPAAVPSIQTLLDGEADEAVPLPAQFPAETPKSEAINGHQSRFSDSALHEHLHSNIVAPIMAFTQEPFPSTLSDRIVADYGHDAPFRHHSVVRQWIEDIFTRGGHDKRLELNTTVEHAERRGPGGEWVLTLRKELPTKNYWWQETFDALVVASGHYNVPWLPQIDGLVEYNQRFPGRVSHSKHFRSVEEFRGKKVIVVGGAVSARDIIHEILPVAQHPVIASFRSGPTPIFGNAPFDHPHIQTVKQITYFNAVTGDITLIDGQVVRGVDRIVFATSYTFSLPFLPHVQDRIKRANRRLPGVYQHTWDIEDPTLAFVGMLGGGFTFKVYEYQAVAVARRLAGRGRVLPSRDEQRAWERDRVARLKGGRDYYSIAPHFREYIEFLRNIAGDPAPGTTGRVLPPFDNAWLEIWSKAPAIQLAKWARNKERAEKELAQRPAQAKL